MTGREARASRREPIEQIERTVEDLKRKIQEIPGRQAESAPEIPVFADSRKDVSDGESRSRAERKKAVGFIRDNVRHAVGSSEEAVRRMRKEQDESGIRCRMAGVLKEVSSGMDGLLTDERKERLYSVGKSAAGAARAAGESFSRVLHSQGMQVLKKKAADLTEQGIRMTKAFLDRKN